MSNEKRDFKKEFTTFIKAEKMGVCPYCNEDVFNDQLYIDDKNNVVSHYSCYNLQFVKGKKRNKKEKE